MDERAALEELERLRDQVQRYRAQRRAAGDEFERLVGSFRKVPVPPPQTAVDSPIRSPFQQVEPLMADEPPVASAASPARQEARSGRGILVFGMLVLVAAAAFVIWSLRPRVPKGDSAGAASPSAARVPARPSQPPAGAPTNASELTTIRPVWLRVVADGKVLLERQLPANARLPLAAQKTIVIRAGDAGAVRLRLRGQDQGPLGEAGQVVTRRFDVPPRQ
jgi:hypothetical protein